MKKISVLILLIFFCNCFLGGTMVIDGLKVLEEIAVWVYLFKEKNNQLPCSINELIDKTPCEPSNRIKKLFDFYKKSYVINFNYIVANEKIEITLKDGNDIFLFENENDRYCFYENGELVIEYRRDLTGKVIDRKEYFTIDPEDENIPFQMVTEVSSN